MKPSVFLSIFITTTSLHAGALESLENLDAMVFTVNQGQWHEMGLFRTGCRNADIWLVADGVILQFDSRVTPGQNFSRFAQDLLTEFEVEALFETLIMKSSFIGASPDVSVEGLGLLSCQSNYFIGSDPSKWRTNVPGYGGVIYRGLYPGIDVVYTATAVGLEYDIIVHPGADLSKLLIKYDGADATSITRDGQLRIETPWETITEEMPFAYQEWDGQRTFVDASYVLFDNGVVGYSVSEYDARFPLIIDPSVELAYSTYLGGSGNDVAIGIDLDDQGNMFITGLTGSSDFPLECPYQGSLSGNADIFIAKINPDLNQLIFSTFLGGSGTDHGRGVSVSPTGNVFITGNSTSSDFPTMNPFQSELNGLSDIIVSKVSSEGDQLLYSTYIGGESTERGNSISVDNSGCAYLTGYSNSHDYPLENPYQEQYLGGYPTAIVTKLSPDGGSLQFSTYLGGDADGEIGYAVTVGEDGCATVTGLTHSWDFPLQNPIQANLEGVCDAFITKFSPSGNQLVFSTFLGGSNYDEGHGIALDADGAVYVAGQTDSPDFPLQNPFINTYGGGFFGDGFVTKLDASGSHIVYSTFLGGSGEDGCEGIDVDNDGCAYVVGFTLSYDFPLANEFQSILAGSEDAFVTRFTPWGNTVYYSTFLGGSESDFCYGVAVDDTGSAFLIGKTESVDFPLENPFQGFNMGEYDAFMAGFGPEGTPIQEMNAIPLMDLAITSVAPNPFSTVLEVGLSVPEAGLIELCVFDITGRKVASIANQTLEPGTHEFVWNASGYPIGVYYIYARGYWGDTAFEKVLLLNNCMQ